MREQQHTDGELVARVLSGDQRAFSQIVDRYKDNIASVVMGMTGDVSMTTDIAQQTFIRTFRFLDKFEGRSSFKTYITRIAINLSLNALKARQRDTNRFVDLDRTTMLLPAEEVNREEREIVHRALAQLDDKHRSVVSLRMIEGYSTKETAQVLEISEGTVMSRLSRGMDKMKHILKELGYEK